MESGPWKMWKTWGLALCKRLIEVSVEFGGHPQRTQHTL